MEWPRFFVVAFALAGFAAPADAAGVSRSYSYFSVRGATLQDLTEEVARNGPEVESTGKRHPGATRLEFKDNVKFDRSHGRCRIKSATVTVKARIILPRWTRRSSGSPETQQVWDALSSDIKRHEESHVLIAKNHARDMETAIRAIPPQANCERLAELGRNALTAGLARHDAEQARFDRIEGKNFSARLERLIRYRATRTKRALR